MSFVSWFWFFVAVIGWIVGWIGSSAAEKQKKENRQLRRDNIITYNRMEYFRKKSEHNSVFDFEKVNDKGEK